MNDLSYKLRLYKLNRRERKLRAAYIRVVDDARKNGGWEAEQEARSTEAVDLEMVQDEIDHIISWHLISKANQMFIAIPEFSAGEKNSHWEQSRFTGSWRLNPEARATVYQAVKKERKESWELMALIIGAVTGLIGVIIGLVSVVRK